MLIKSITVENFLPFQGKQTVGFSTDQDRNVTIIMGDNGAGKTALAQAFEWCLYGKTPKDSNGKDCKGVINAFVRDRISPGSYCYAAVEVALIKDGTAYEIVRKQKYERRPSGKMDSTKHEFTILHKEDGQSRPIPLSEQRATIDKLLASELSHYFFFDGEHVKNMRAEIEQGKSSDFADAVKTILGLQPIAAARQHLKAPGTRRSVTRWFEGQIDLKGDQDLEQKSGRISTLEKKTERLQGSIKEAQDDKYAAEQNVGTYEQLLKENAASEEAQKAVEKAKRLAREAKRSYADKRNAFFKIFRAGYYRLFIDKLVRDAEVELAEEDKIDKGVPSVDNKTIEFLLEREECICGTKFKTGDDVAQHLYEMLQYVPPKALGTYISNFSTGCKARTETPLTLYGDLVAAYQDFDEAEREVIEADAAVSTAQTYLASINHVDVALLRENLRKAEEDRDRAVGRESNARREIAGANKEIEQLKSEISAYSVQNAKNIEIKRCLAYVGYIYDYLSDYYKVHESKTRVELERVVNRFFTEMYDGELHLELDENYGVKVIVDDIDTSNETWRTSSGQTLAIILAFILGILDIAKNNNLQDGNLMQGDTYPLVMDAPLSDFDKTRIGTICGLLPEVAEQVIIIIKDTDGELAEQHMQDKIGRRYNIARIRDYESEIRPRD